MKSDRLNSIIKSRDGRIQVERLESRHATKHGVSIEEVEYVIRNARRPFPRRVGNDKWQVVGRGNGDRFVQAVYVIEDDQRLFVIHAMPLTTRRRRG